MWLWRSIILEIIHERDLRSFIFVCCCHLLVSNDHCPSGDSLSHHLEHFSTPFPRQVVKGVGYGRRADVWSMGVILYVFLAGFLPFDEVSTDALFAKIAAADFSYPEWMRGMPEARALIDSILVADPAARATLAEIQRHPWFVGGGGWILAVGLFVGGGAKPAEGSRHHGGNTNGTCPFHGIFRE